MKFEARVAVKLKENVKDAKGEAVSAVLRRIGLEEAANVRLGKLFELEITAQNEDEAKNKLQNIIKEVFVNPVVETHTVLEFKEIQA